MRVKVNIHAWIEAPTVADAFGVVGDWIPGDFTDWAMDGYPDPEGDPQDG